MAGAVFLEKAIQDLINYTQINKQVNKQIKPPFWAAVISFNNLKTKQTTIQNRMVVFMPIIRNYHINLCRII